MLIKIGKSKGGRSSKDGIIVKRYEHFNKAFGKWHDGRGRYISSRADYEKAMHEEGMITEEQARREGFTDTPKRKDYKVKKDTWELLNSLDSTKDSKGNIKLGDVAIKAINDKIHNAKMAQQNNRALPKHYQDKGGFSE